MTAEPWPSITPEEDAEMQRAAAAYLRDLENRRDCDNAEAYRLSQAPPLLESGS